ncbi:MAG: hypothetical protein IKM01_02835 [Clostridia bacterium]|nr:hypothetical protein [Clostridia bacterium]
MEILKKTLPALLVMAILMTVLVVCAPLSSFSALADNSNIGEGAGTLIVKQSDSDTRFFGVIDGMSFTIEAPATTEKIYVAFEDDVGDWQIANQGEVGIVPYIEIDAFNATEAGKYNSVKKYKENGKWYAKVKVHSNGYLHVKAEVRDADSKIEEIEDIIDVTAIDWRAPKLNLEKTEYYADSSDGVYKMQYKMRFEDPYKGTRYTSACSGLLSLLIFSSSSDLSPKVDEGGSKPSEGGDNVDKDDITNSADYNEIVNKNFSENQMPVVDFDAEFTAEKNGYYYFLVVDKSGNAAFGSLFKYTKERLPEYNITTNINGYDATINVKETLDAIQKELDDNKGKINEDIYEDLESSYSIFMECFTSSWIDASRKKDVNKLYYEMIEYRKVFYNALKGPSVRVDVINAELFPGKITVSNLDGSIVNGALYGDEILVTIIVSRWDASDYPEGAKLDMNVGEANYVYKLTYTLTLEGEVVTPTKPLNFAIEKNANCNVLGISASSSSTKYQEVQYTYGNVWLRFSTSYASRDFHLYASYDGPKKDLTWLWITLGVVGGVAIAVGITLIILNKKGIIKIGRPKKATEEPKEEVKTQVVNNKKVKNKKKKGR